MSNKIDLYTSAMVLAGVGDAMGYKNGDWEFSFDGEKIHQEMKKLGGIKKLKINKKDFRVSDDTVLLLSTAEALIDVKRHGNDLNKLYVEIATHYKKDYFNDMSGRAGGFTTSNSCAHLEPLREDGWHIPFNPRGGGCGAAMRSMCIGLRYPNIYDKTCLENLICVSVESGRMTHNHPTGFLGSFASALFGSLSLCKIPLNKWGSIMLLLLPKVLKYIELVGRDVVQNTKHWSYFTEQWVNYLTTRNILSGESEVSFPSDYNVKARDLFYKSLAYSTWGGSSGHDAPMIAYDALLAAGNDWEKLCHHGMLHSGDNDSTGVISGFCYGAMHGIQDVPSLNYKSLEYKDRLLNAGEKLFELASNDGYINEMDACSGNIIPVDDLFS